MQILPTIQEENVGCSEKWLFNQLSFEQTIYCQILHTVWFISGERLKEKIEVDHSWELKGPTQPLPCVCFHPIEAPKSTQSPRGKVRPTWEWVLTRENNWWYGWNTDYKYRSKDTHFRWKTKWRLELLGAPRIMGENTPFKIVTGRYPFNFCRTWNFGKRGQPRQVYHNFRNFQIENFRSIWFPSRNFRF